MPKAEGRKFKFNGHEAIDTKVLETLAYNGGRQTVLIESEEFSAVCPYSGLPDYGKITIEYVPKKVIVELKSLKYYFVSYRNVGIYQEEAADRIFKDLKKPLKPEHLKITLKYKTRGGMDTTCVVEGKGERGNNGVAINRIAL